MLGWTRVMAVREHNVPEAGATDGDRSLWEKGCKVGSRLGTSRVRLGHVECEMPLDILVRTPSRKWGVWAEA
jgi:hypothetical protein